MDTKRLAAYKLAEKMDEQRAQDKALEEQARLENFLKTISQIESSGGKDFSHDEIQSGIHKGHRAAGRYGLMPNTVHEVLNRMRFQGDLPEDLNRMYQMEPQELKKYIEHNPEIENKLASQLGKKVLERQGGDEEKAAYSWFQGHNLTPQEIEERGYDEHDYVKKYRKYRGQ